MSADNFRLSVVILMAIFVASFTWIGLSLAQSVRYRQFDLQKSSSPDGRSILEKPPGYVFDSWTGRRIPMTDGGDR